MKNKYLICLLVGLGLMAVVLTMMSLLRRPPTPAPPAITPASNSNPGSQTQNFDSALPATNTNDSAIPNPAMRLSELEALGINPENIYPDNTPPELRSDTTLANNQNFMITYLAGPNQFQLSLYTQPFQATQEAAEQTLLTELQISQEVACRLPIVIVKVTPNDGQLDEVTRKLSFCP